MSYIIVNGDKQPWSETKSLSELLSQLSFTQGPMAVAVNRRVIAAKDLDATIIHSGDCIDILTAMQGG